MESRYTKKDLDKEARIAVKQFIQENKRKATLDHWELVLGNQTESPTLQVHIKSENETGIFTYCWNIAI